MKNLVLPLVLFLNITCLSAANLVWIGGNGNWNVAANWNTGTIPTAIDDVSLSTTGQVTIPVGYTAQADLVSLSNSNSPLIIDGTGTFTHLTVTGSAVLTVNGTLNIVSNTLAIFPFTISATGVVHNYGNINIENCRGGLANSGSFTNHSGALLSIINLTENLALANGYGSGTTAATFVNEANAGIQIENGLSGLKNGDNEPVSSLNHIFDNYGTISIEDVDETYSQQGSITNFGVFTNRNGGEINVIGALNIGIKNRDLFVNEQNATILVDGAGQEGWFNHGESEDFAMLTNSGTITLNNANTQNNTFDNVFTAFDDFVNTATGTFIISNGHQNAFVRASRVGYIGSSNNYGLIDIQGTYAQKGLKVAHSMINHPCGIIKVGDTKIDLSTTSVLNNNGWLEITHNATISFLGLLINNGVIGDQYGKMPTAVANVQNNKFIVKQTTGTACINEALPGALTVTSLTGFTVNGFYTDAAATISAGTYNTGANTFTPNGNATGLTTLYVKVTDNTENCTFTFVKVISGGVLGNIEFFIDTDGDGYGGNASVEACTAPPGYVNNDADCDDNDPLELPGQIWYRDTDGDDYSNGTSLTQCLRPAGAYYAASELMGTNNDCDDNDPLEFPGQIWYRDTDGDDYSNGINLIQCLRPPGAYFAASELLGTNNDCDDNDPLEHPGQVWYRDFDGDDYSNGTTLMQCLRPANYYVASELLGTNNDCDDNDPLEHPGQIWYVDADGDDHSDGDFMVQCLRPANHYVAAELVNLNDDCDDGDATVYAGAPELCDNQDNDCDNLTDEGVCGVSCADPKIISTLPYTFAGSTNGFANNYTSAHACNSNHMNGNDFVLKYEPVISQVGRIRLQNTGTPPGTVIYGHAVFVLDGCPDAPGTNCLYSGTWGSSTNGPINIETVPFQAGQTYYIVVSSNPAYHQWFDFTLTIDLPVGNICENAHVINALPYALGGTTQLLGDDYGAGDACASAHMSGNDVVFTYTTAVDQVARIRLQNTNIPAGSSIYGHAVFLLDGCPDDPATNCIASQTYGNATNSVIYIETAVLTAGQTYYIVVASNQVFHQWFNYLLTIDLPTGNICQNAFIINTLPNSLSASTRFLGDDYDNGDACMSPHMSGNDVVFKYTPAANQVARIKLENTGLPPGSTIYGHAVFLLDGCPDDPGTSCVASRTAASGTNNPLYMETVFFTAGQTYYIVVASNQVYHQWFNYILTIDLPLGNVCENAVPVSTLPYNASSQSTCLFGDDYNSTMACSSPYMNGNDFVYQYTPAASGSINIELSNLTATFTGIFFLDGCPNAGGSTCASATNNGMGNYALNNRPVTAGHTYYIVISSNDFFTDCFGYSIAVTPSALPVELVQFKVEKTDETAALLQWQTASEVEFSHFDIERSTNGVDWIYRASAAGKGDNSTYSYSDDLRSIAPGESWVYYRLRMMDRDGDVEYSPVASLALTRKNSDVRFFPNPTDGLVTISGLDGNEEMEVTVMDAVGKVAFRQIVTTNLDLSGLPGGIYIISVYSGGKAKIGKVSKE